MTERSALCASGTRFLITLGARAGYSKNKILSKRI